jgi:hypothetical protein
MDRHVTVLGVLNLALGLSGLVAAPVVLISMVGGGLVTEQWTQMLFVPMLGVAITLLIALFSVPTLIAGVALLRGTTWAHPFGLVIAALSLVNFPIGTPVGVYGLWVLSRRVPNTIPSPGSGILQSRAVS